MDPLIDLVFPVQGTFVPVDHGYALYGSLSRTITEVHGADWIAIHGIAGRRFDAETISIEERGVLRIRVPTARIATLLPLVGATIELSGRTVQIGPPRVFTLKPAAILDARLVVIRLTGGVPNPFDAAEFEKRFVAEAQRQLVKLNIRADLEISGRQRLKVGGQRVIGYSVRAHGLSPEDSLKLQAAGIGGKRTMGCGIFRPARIVQPARKVA